jgi:hypothetical protein
MTIFYAVCLIIMLIICSMIFHIQYFDPWLKRRDAAKRILKFEQGYNYAIVALLHGTTFNEIEALACNPFDRDEFEQGMDQALLDARRTFKDNPL